MVELGIEALGILDNKNARVIERFCHCGVAKDFSVPRAFGACFEISLD